MLIGGGECEEEVYKVDCHNFAYMAQLLGEVLNMAILDTGCTQTVCGKSWLSIYRSSLSDELNSRLVIEDSTRIFKFGDGQSTKSCGKIKIPICLEGVTANIWLETDFIEKDLPLLMSKSAMKKARTVIEFNESGEESVKMFGHTQKLVVTESGHLCIPLNNFQLDHSFENHENVVMFSGLYSIPDLTENQKKSVAVKLHKQFAHPASQRLVKLLRNGGVKDKVLLDLVEKVTNECDVCLKYKRPHLTPIVCFPRATEFNENVGLDLKQIGNKYMLHFIDHFTRYSQAIVINNKEAQTIVNGTIRSWVAIFGPPKSVLSDNGKEFDNEKYKELCEKLNITVTYTAAESPWSNGVNERHNGLLAEMVYKLVADGHDIKQAVRCLLVCVIKKLTG